MCKEIGEVRPCNGKRSSAEALIKATVTMAVMIKTRIKSKFRFSVAMIYPSPSILPGAYRGP